jgi:Protein of unknown function (DUF3433)
MVDSRHLATSWRPYTLRWPFLVTLIIFSLTLIIAVQLLHNQSRRNGGLIFAPNIANLPLSATFQYQHLPTIVFVLYSMIWSWIDLDVRRIEPFYQLSKPNGAKGSESMLLQYPVDIVISVPIRAAQLG